MNIPSSAEPREPSRAVEQAEIALFEAMSGAICDAATALLNAGLTHLQTEQMLSEALSQAEIADSIDACVWLVNKK